MIRICNTQGTVLCDVDDRDPLHARLSGQLDQVRVGDRVVIDSQWLEVVGRSHVLHAGQVTVGKKTQAWADERTVITVAPRRRNSSHEPKARITTRSAAR